MPIRAKRAITKKRVPEMKQRRLRAIGLQRAIVNNLILLINIEQINNLMPQKLYLQVIDMKTFCF